MGLAGYAADEITDKAVEAAGYMLLPAMVFPPVEPLAMLMGVGKGGPGTVAEGSANWTSGSDALASAREQAESLFASFTDQDWSGDDRAAFDVQAQQFVDQLDISAEFSGNVGLVLAGLSVMLAPYGGICVGIGGVMLSEALAFEAAVASVVGNVGFSEAAYAAGVATGVTCLAVLGATIGTYAMVMEAAAAAITLGAMGEAKDLAKHGDAGALDRFRQAEVDGLGEVAENLEGFAVGVAGDFVAGKATEGMPAVTTAEKVIKHAIEGQLGSRIGDDNSALVDAAKGEGPLTVLKDVSGYGDEIDEAEDLFDGDEPLPEDTVHYDLPPEPTIPPSNPVQPLPPADPGGPNVVPIPDAGEDDPQVIPAGDDINGTTSA